ncbi:MAG TPA: hypothetical protein VKC53_00655 [Patescibacteria group bacterium]|nr:hypothetical protein [Patescibacteria group bacterium]
MLSKLVNKNAKELFIYISFLVILLLISINFDNYLKPKQIRVLGTETDNSEEVFWNDFLNKNPSYIPGWIETGSVDKAKLIDPNYEIK